VFGTIITALTCGYILFAFATSGVVPLDPNSALESLLFGTAISATDSVAILALLGAKEVKADPMLYSLVFGESVMNDAVVIVLYNTFEGFLGGPIEASTLFGGVGLFFYTAIVSTIVGGLIGLFCCILFKYVDFTEHSTYELTLTMSFAYVSYFVAEFLHLSGIMSLFFCSIVLAHYNHYNMSRESQISTHESFRSFAQIAETFVFAYMGIQLGVALSPHAPPELAWNMPLVFVTLFACAISRFLNIYPLSIVVNNFRQLQIPLRMQFPMWFSGLRGAVAFALAMKVPTDNGSYIITTTLAVVIATLSAGGLTLPILKFTRMAGSNIQEDFDRHYTLEDIKKHEMPLMAKMTAAWLRFDNSYMRRFFNQRWDPNRLRLDGFGRDGLHRGGALEPSGPVPFPLPTPSANHRSSRSEASISQGTERKEAEVDRPDPRLEMTSVLSSSAAASSTSTSSSAAASSTSTSSSAAISSAAISSALVPVATQPSPFVQQGEHGGLQWAQIEIPPQSSSTRDGNP